jgi:hypothetical protein
VEFLRNSIKKIERLYSIVVERQGVRAKFGVDRKRKSGVRPAICKRKAEKRGQACDLRFSKNRLEPKPNRAQTQTGVRPAICDSQLNRW